ncbi:hypothetical protein D3C77_452190 [compost metagenome]
MQYQRTLDHLSLVPHTSSIQAGSGTAEFDGRATDQGTRQRAGRGGVANAHLTTDKQLAGAGRGTQGALAAALQCLQALLAGHCRGHNEIRRASTDSQVVHARQIQFRVDGAQIHHFQVSLKLAREDADRCATADKVVQHLRSHRLRISRDAFGDHAMVTGKNRDADLVQARLELPLQARQLDRDKFQAPEGAGRLGQLLLTRHGLSNGLLIEGTAGIKPPGLTHGAVPFKVRGRPATVSTTRWQRSAMAWCNQPASST